MGLIFHPPEDARSEPGYLIGKDGPQAALNADTFSSPAHSALVRFR
jgi:hypothetical protein